MTALLRPLGVLWITISVLAGLTAAMAVALDEGELSSLFVVTFALGGFPGLLLIAATRHIPIRARAVDSLGLALLGWISAPLFAAFPLFLSGVYQPVDAIFEAYSALTTTGAALMPPEDLPRSLVFWRALLSWFGGFATLLLAAAVLAALDKDGPAIRHSVLLTAQSDNIFSHLRLAALRIGVIYLILTLLVLFALVLSGQSVFNALVLAFSALSTGGYAPVSGELDLYLSPISVGILAAGCLAGALNISIFWDALNDRRAVLDPDLAGIAGLVLGLAVLFAIADPGHALAHAADAVFAMTTAGYFTDGSGIPVPVAALFAALIGGAAASTSGGVKVSRILLLWRRMGVELALLADPSRITRVRFRGRAVPDRALIAVWTYVLAFAAVLGVGGVLVAASGQSFERSFAAVASALANAGPLFDASGEGRSWNDLSDGGKAAVVPVMILGRLEVLAALAAFGALIGRRWSR